MPWYRIPGGGVCHINMGRRKGSAPAPCRACGWVSTRLCDWKLPSGRDCNASICQGCSFSPAPGKDLCPVHVAYYRRWLVETQLIPLC